MARGYEIAVGADGREFEQGIKKDVIKPLEDAARSLDNLADAADDAGRDGARGVDKLEDALKDAQKQSEKTERAVEDIGDGGGRGLGKIKQGAQEVQQEIGQNLGETVASFSGDLSDLGQVGQDSLGGLAATIAGSGPAGIVGAAALAAGAVGLGAITASLQSQQEEAEKLRARLSDAYSAAAEEGRNYLDTAQLIAAANDLMFDPDRADEWKQVQQDAKDLGIDWKIVTDAHNGSLESQEQVHARIGALLEEQAAEQFKMGEDLAALSTVGGTELDHLAERWGALTEQTRAQADQATRNGEITSFYLQKQIQEAGTATEAIDALGNRLYTLPDGTEILIDADTGQATTDVDKFKGDLDGKVPTVKTTTIKVNVQDNTKTDVDRIVRRINGQVAEIRIKGSRQLIAR